jgi:hypothetical protein
VLKQPGHGHLGVIPAGRQKGFLTTDCRETHRFKLRHGDSVELWSSRGGGGLHVELFLAGLSAFAGISIKSQLIGYFDRDFCASAPAIGPSSFTYQALSASN